MKKIIVFLSCICVSSFIIWIISIVAYAAINDFPKEAPHIFLIWGGGTCMIAFIAGICWLISIRHIIASDIKRYLNS